MIKQLRDFSLPPDRACKVCVSGGIGSGKSTFTNAIVSLGGVRFDADEVLRVATAPGGVALPLIRDVFGPEVFVPDGTLNRVALASIVFSNSAKKAQLEAILHPLVWQEMDRTVQSLSSDDVLIAEIPLIAETGNHHRFDVVIMVDAPESTRLERLVQNRNMDREDVRARIRAQAKRFEREAIAHIWIDNTGTSESLMADAEEVWRLIVKP